jgi:hypothetical protein
VADVELGSARRALQGRCLGRTTHRGDRRVVHGRPRRARAHRGPGLVRLLAAASSPTRTRRRSGSSASPRPSSPRTGPSPPRSRSRWRRAPGRDSGGPRGRGDRRRRAGRGTAAKPVGLVYVASDGGGSEVRRYHWTGDRGRTSARAPGLPWSSCSRGWRSAGDARGSAADRRRAGARPGCATDRGRRADPRRLAPPGRGASRRRCSPPGRRGGRHGLRSRRSVSQYTDALDAAGIAVAWAHDAAHVRGPPAGPPRRDQGPDRVARIIRSSVPHARAAGSRGGVAAGRGGRGGRATLVAVAGTHGKSTTAGWLVHLLVRGRRGPRSAFVGALLPAARHRRGRGRRRRGGGSVRRSSSRRTSTPATSTPYRPAVAVLTCGVGPPRRVRGPRGGDRGVRGVAPAGGFRDRTGASRSSWRTSRTTAWPRWWSGSRLARAGARDGACGRRRSVPAGSHGGSGSGSGALRVRRMRSSAGSWPPNGTGRCWRSPGWIVLPGRSVSGSHRRASQRSQRPRGGGRGSRAGGSLLRPSWRGWSHSGA